MLFFGFYIIIRIRLANEVDFLEVKRIVTREYQENCYIVWDDTKKGAIIDPGGSMEKIVSHIEKNNIEITAILMTHGHFDHIGCAKELSEKYGVSVTMNEKEKIVVEDGWNHDCMPFENPENYNFVKENDVVRVGNMNFEVLQTPGHTVGSVCYFFDNTLFSGDTLFLQTVGRWDFFTGSLEDIKNSVKNKLFLLPEDTKVYPGHGFSTSIGEEKINNGILMY